MTEKQYELRSISDEFGNEVCTVHDNYLNEAMSPDEVVVLLNSFAEENEELKEENINQFALIRMFEDTKGVSIEDIIWNTRGYHTQTEFDDDFVEYRENAKKRWIE